MVTFNATCPNGHTRQHLFYKDRLKELVDERRLMLWCMECDEQWHVSSDELDGLRRLLRLHD
ncbi:MAG TPA: hypothetical protein VLY46_00225 [Usitatibacter sp.]|nr:hypothetical protein [Usitatibacter sp.]